jgi:FMN phosphatase YigB (HAD superfamily)
MQPKFLYFDLGKVLIHFSAERMYQQIADVAGIGVEKAQAVISGDGLLRQYESGRLSDREFYEEFCVKTGSRPSFDAMATAASEIFDLNLPMLPLVTQVRQAGYPIGILSNTCTIHWDYCARHYRIVTEGFDVYALSFRIGAVKPEAAIFHAAAELAGVRPEEIFFVDDLPGHVAGARAVGFDAVQFTTAAALADELRKRGIRFNY